MRSRCVGRRAARALPREKVARCPKACRGSKPEGLLNPQFSLPLERDQMLFPLPPSLREVPRRGGRSHRVAARRICERSPYGNRCAFHACVSFSQKIFCFAKSFLGALQCWPPLCKGRESAFLSFRAPTKIAWRVLREEERQAYNVMRQTKRAAAPPPKAPRSHFSSSPSVSSSKVIENTLSIRMRL